MSSPLVELAKEILLQAEKLEKQLQRISAPHPSLEQDAPWHYPSSVEHPEVWATRESIATMSKKIFQLSLGPADMIRYMTGPERCSLPLLKIMDRFDVYELVPRNGSIPFEELAGKMKVHPEIVKRIFRMASGINLFKEEPKGQVAHTSLSTALPMLSPWIKLVCRRDFSDAYASWPDAMLLYDEPKKPGSNPFNFANGYEKSLFGVMQDEDGMALFTEAMKSVEEGQDAGHFVHGFDWAGLDEGPVVDLGGGNGHISIPIAKAHPRLRIIIQDVEVNKEHAAKLIPAELRDRITFQVQDFFQPQTTNTGAKVFFMRHIIHDWPDEDAARILQQLIPELEKGAKVFICDRAPTSAGPRLSHYEASMQCIDLLMWTLVGAQERSVEQWHRLLGRTDKRLKLLSLKVPVGSEHAMIEIGF